MYNAHHCWVIGFSKTSCRGVNVRIPRFVYCILLGLVSVATPCWAADPPIFLNPLKGFVRSPFSAELELYSGGITGKSAGEAFNSATKGDYGIRFTLGFLKALNINLNYMYSNQTRSFTAVTPPIATLPSGTALMHAANLNMFFGNGEMNLFKMRRSTFYLSPGVGFVRTGARSMTIVTPLGIASSPILPAGTVTFNLGAGIKVFPLKHYGLRFDVRDYVSGGATGTLNPAQSLTISGSTISNPGQFFGVIPVQNNLVFTVGLIFKLI
jgi:hypothetical protein